MLRSMFSAVTGLRNHQVRMDVIGNNIANVNTPGFKRSRVTFQDALSQLMRGASRADAGRGGTNPMQVGLGMNLGAIDTFHTQGSMEGTGRMTDLGIDGAGFFVVRGTGDTHLYTRAGAFGWDAAGYLVNGDGRIVQGQRWDLDTGEWEQQIGDIQLRPEDKQARPRQTGEITFTGNLAADAGQEPYVRTVTVYDVLGEAHTVTVHFTKQDDGQWEWAAQVGGEDFQGVINFDGDGQFVDSPDSEITIDGQDISLDFSGLTQYAASGESYLEVNQDGFSQGTLEEVSIDSAGIVTGVFSNGTSRPLLRLALANFANPEGLTSLGNSLFAQSNNSGPAQLGVAGQGAFGSISPSALEMSNVDLAQEFTDMIVTQRGFQANSRIITVSDEMLQELVNMKR